MNSNINMGKLHVHDMMRMEWDGMGMHKNKIRWLT